MDKYLKKYLATCKAKSLSELSSTQLKDFIVVRYNAFEVLEYGTQEDIQELIRIGKEAIKTESEVNIGMYINEDPEIDNTRVYYFSLVAS